MRNKFQAAILSLLARGPLRCGAQCDEIGHIGLKPPAWVNEGIFVDIGVAIAPISSPRIHPWATE